MLIYPEECAAQEGINYDAVHEYKTNFDLFKEKAILYLDEMTDDEYDDISEKENLE